MSQLVLCICRHPKEMGSNASEGMDSNASEGMDLPDSEGKQVKSRNFLFPCPLHKLPLGAVA